MAVKLMQGNEACAEGAIAAGCACRTASSAKRNAAFVGYAGCKMASSVTWLVRPLEVSCTGTAILCPPIASPTLSVLDTASAASITWPSFTLRVRWIACSARIITSVGPIHLARMLSLPPSWPARRTSILTASAISAATRPARCLTRWPRAASWPSGTSSSVGKPTVLPILA